MNHGITSFLTVLLASSLSACGGGSDTPPTDSDEASNLSPDNTVATIDPDIALVAGIYKTSRSNDESYLYISEQGEVTIYDYQGDSVGTGNNCYSEATTVNQINFDFNNSTLSYSASTQIYTIEGDVHTLEFVYLDSLGMHAFSLDSSISTGTGLDLNFSGYNVKIGGDGAQQETNIVISDIQGAICS